MGSYQPGGKLIHRVRDHTDTVRGDHTDTVRGDQSKKSIARAQVRKYYIQQMSTMPNTVVILLTG